MVKMVEQPWKNTLTYTEHSFGSFPIENLKGYISEGLQSVARLEVCTVQDMELFRLRV